MMGREYMYDREEELCRLHGGKTGLIVMTGKPRCRRGIIFKWILEKLDRVV
jgi:hypothetical protein